MLPRPYRMVASTEFAATVRRGRRTGRPSLVVHSDLAPPEPAADPDVRVGFVVSKAVGGAVVRKRVQRRLRHLVADRITEAPAGLRVVIRALPAAAVDPGRLADDLGAAWSAAARAGWTRS